MSNPYPCKTHGTYTDGQNGPICNQAEPAELGLSIVNLLSYSLSPTETEVIGLGQVYVHSKRSINLHLPKIYISLREI